MYSWIKAINDYYGDAQPGTSEWNEKDLLSRLILFWTDKLPGLPERSSHHFCVSDILSYPDVPFSESFGGKDVRVQLWLSDDAPVETETFDIDALKRQLDSLPDNLEDSSIPESVKNKVILLRKVIINGGVVKRALLGRFVSKPTPAIHLYMGNIRAENDPLSARAVTFVHEIFHAWNYFRAGEKDRTVPELDEAMVEAATLFLVNEFQMQTKQSVNWCPEILDWSLDALCKKQDSFVSL